jgi:3-oxoadipate enol-lactonase
MPRVRAGEVDLYYEWHGPEGAPVLVLNNGILMSAASSWIPQQRAFAARFRLLLYDCRGQGLSDHPAVPYSMAQHADDLACLLDALGVERAHVLGISYGGEVAQSFAIRHANRTRSLVLADTVSEVGPELRLVVESWLDAARRAVPDEFFRATVPWNFSPAFIRANAALLEDARRRYALLDYPAVVRLGECFLGLHLTPDLARVLAPTCILYGDLDLIKGRAYAEILHRHIAGSELHVIEGAGHASCWEQPQAFNRLVLEFLDRLG